MRKFDAVIILGGGVSDKIAPILYTKDRIEYFVKFKSRFKNTPIILSGGYSLWLKSKPKHTEAEIMSSYLIKHGLENDRLFLDTKSRDTVGNAIYSKQIIIKHYDWKKLGIITTEGHGKRALWIFKKVFGPKYTIEVIEVPTKMTTFHHNPGRDKYESYIVSTYKQVLKGCKSGDEKAIVAALKKCHPVYSKSKIAQKLKQQILIHKKKFLGYVHLEQAALKK